MILLEVATQLKIHFPTCVLDRYLSKYRGIRRASKWTLCMILSHGTE